MHHVVKPIWNVVHLVVVEEGAEVVAARLQHPVGKEGQQQHWDQTPKNTLKYIRGGFPLGSLRYWCSLIDEAFYFHHATMIPVWKLHENEAIEAFEICYFEYP